MSANKPHGGKVSELTKLKNLSADQREAIWAWRAEVDSKGIGLTNTLIRNRIAEKFQIRLSRDGQLSDFWSWQQHQRRLENYNVLLENFEEFYRKTHPGESVERVRQAGISFFMTESVANGDRESFTDVARLDQTERTGATKAIFKQREVTLSEQKYLDTKKSEQEKALEFCLDEAKEFPDVLAKFKDAFASLKKAKATK